MPETTSLFETGIGNFLHGLTGGFETGEFTKNETGNEYAQA